jgi:site-specific DNA recombinase
MTKEKTTVKKRVALYVRVSTIEQAEKGYSVDEQIDRLKKYCAAKDWAVSKVYKDPGFSGSNINRPELSKLIKEAKNFDVILVYKLDRLSRSQKDTLYLIEEVFAKADTQFVSLSENFDTSTPFGKATVGILSVFAQLEREQIKERMAMGKIGRAKAGKPSGVSKVPFGYAYSGGELGISNTEAAVVKNIFADFLAGNSINSIQKRLNEKGFVGKSSPWRLSSIRSVITNRTYTGKVIFRGVSYEGKHKAIISETDFEKAQSEMVRRQDQAYMRNKAVRPFQSKYLLSGLLRCINCNKSFIIHQGDKNKEGFRKSWYKCKSFANQEFSHLKDKNFVRCPERRYPLEELEPAILQEIEQLRLNPEELTSKTLSNNTNEFGAEALEKERTSLEAKLNRAMNLYIDGKFPLDALTNRKEQLEKQIAGINASLDQIRKNRVDFTAEKAKDFLATLLSDVHTLDYEDQKKVVRTLIDYIELGGEQVVVHWRFTPNSSINS